MWRVPFVEFSHRRVSGGLVKLGRAGFGVAMHDDNLRFINHLLILPDIKDVLLLYLDPAQGHEPDTAAMLRYPLG